MCNKDSSLCVCEREREREGEDDARQVIIMPGEMLQVRQVCVCVFVRVCVRACVCLIQQIMLLRGVEGSISCYN